MTPVSITKLNHLLQGWPTGTVGLAVWLGQQGISNDLQHYYRRSGWIEAVGHGAFQRAGDTPDWLGGLYAVQQQAHLDIHVGGRTALGLQGQAHYLEMNMQVAHLFAPLKTNMPAWFKNHDWDVKLELHNTDFLPPNLGLEDVEHKLFKVKASGAARAAMECMYLAPNHFELVEAYQIMEGLATVRPSTVQKLMEQCRSVKVKRLFLFMAEKAGHAWFKHLDLSRIDIGAGKRGLADSGVYVPKYQITVPKELVILLSVLKYRNQVRLLQHVFLWPFCQIFGEAMSFVQHAAGSTP